MKEKLQNRTSLSKSILSVLTLLGTAITAGVDKVTNLRKGDVRVIYMDDLFKTRPQVSQLQETESAYVKPLYSTNNAMVQTSDILKGYGFTYPGFNFKSQVFTRARITNTLMVVNNKNLSVGVLAFVNEGTFVQNTINPHVGIFTPRDTSYGIIKNGAVINDFIINETPKGQGVVIAYTDATNKNVVFYEQIRQLNKTAKLSRDGSSKAPTDWNLQTETTRVFVQAVFPDNDTTIAFAYQSSFAYDHSDAKLAASTSLVWSVLGKYNGAIDLKTPITNLARIYGIEVSDDQKSLVISWADSNDNLGVSQCAFTAPTLEDEEEQLSQKLGSKNLKLTCQAAAISSLGITKGRAVVSEGVAYFFDSVKGIMTLCDYSYTARTLSMCIKNRVTPAGISGLVPDLFQVGNGNTVQLTFRKQANIDDNVFNPEVVVYNWRRTGGNYLDFDARSSTDAITSTVGSTAMTNKVFYMLNAVHQSLYIGSNDANAHLTIDTNTLFPSDSGALQTRGIDLRVTMTVGTDVVTKNIEVNLLSSFDDGLEIADLPDFTTYSGLTNKVIKIQRQNFAGNVLEFSLNKNSSLNLLSTDKLTVKGNLMQNVYFTSDKEGVTWEGNTIQAFTCENEDLAGTTLQCNLRVNVSYTKNSTDEFIYMTKSDLVQEYGVIVVTKGKNSTTFVFLGLVFPEFAEVFPYTVQGVVLDTVDDIFFKIAGKLYSFFVSTTNTTTNVTTYNIYSSYNKELYAMPPHPFATLTDFGTLGLPFCPVVTRKNAYDPTIIDVLSTCQGSSILYSMITNNVSQIYATNIKTLNQDTTKVVNACNLGSEVVTLYQSGKLVVSNTKNDNSVSFVDPKDVEISKVSKLICARAAEYAVIVGPKVKTLENGLYETQANNRLAILAGNKQDNQENRWLTALDLGKNKLKGVTLANNGDILLHIYDTNNVLNLYRARTTEIVLVGNATKGALPAASAFVGVTIHPQNSPASIGVGFKYVVETPQTAVKVSNATKNVTNGTYDLFTVADVAGPILNADLKLNGNNLTDNVKFTPRISPDTTYMPQTGRAVNIVEPSAIKHFAKIGVGYTRNLDSTIFYFYKNYDQFQNVEDTGFKTNTRKSVATEFDAESRYSLSALATNEGGEFHFRWWIYTFSWEATYDAGQQTWFIANYIKGSIASLANIAKDVFVATIVDDEDHTAYSYKITVGYDQKDNKYYVGSSQLVLTTPNVYHLSSIGYGNAAILVYTGKQSREVKGVSWTLSDGKAHTLASFDLNTKNQITEIDCQTLEGSGHCMFHTTGVTIEDITLTYDLTNNKWVPFRTISNYFYNDFVPQVCSFNTDFLACRVADAKGDNALFVYNRKIVTKAGSVNKNYPWYALDTQHMYNLKKVTGYTATPVVYKDASGKNVLRVTQSNIVSNETTTLQPYFKAFELGDSVLDIVKNLNKTQYDNITVVFNEGIGQAVNLNFTSFFTGFVPPSNKPGGLGWFIWTVIILGVILLIVVIAFFARSKNDNFDDDEENYDEIGERGKGAGLSEAIDSQIQFGKSHAKNEDDYDM